MCTSIYYRRYVVCLHTDNADKWTTKKKNTLFLCSVESRIIVNNKMGTTGKEMTKVHFKLNPYCSGIYLEEQRIESATLGTQNITSLHWEFLSAEDVC